MKTQILLVMAWCYLLSGCAGLRSSLHYTKGTQQLSCGNYPEAVVELEQAVKLDPSMARNHTNLTAAYIANNNEEKAWFQARQAVRCRYDDGLREFQFMLFCQRKIINPGLCRQGTPWEEISKNLGQPDEYQESENGQIISCTYGICKMSFSNGLLTSCLIGNSEISSLPE
jgi:tetratricopeptide (TPR) repeat protein